MTINDVEDDGKLRLFEVFISPANMEHFAWVVALTRIILAVSHRGGDVAFVAEELKVVFDPHGGQSTARSEIRPVADRCDRWRDQATHDRNRFPCGAGTASRRRSWHGHGDAARGCGRHAMPEV